MSLNETYKNITVSTYDKNFILAPDKAINILVNDINRWDWINEIDIREAKEYSYANIESIREELQILEQLSYQKPAQEFPPYIEFKNYIAASGDLGEFVLQTKNQHGNIVAFYILTIANSSPNHNTPAGNHNKSEFLVRAATYEYHLAHFLFFQHTSAGDYINGNLTKKLQSSIESFKNSAKVSLQEIESTSDTARKFFSESSFTLNRTHDRNKRRAMIALRRYRKIFLSVREEASLAKAAADNDLKTAYNTYHAQVDLKSSVVYWNQKVTQHNKAKWKWLAVVVASIALTFASPVIYYSAGGASALAAKRHQNSPQDLQTAETTNKEQNKSVSPQPELKKESSTPAPNDTMEKVAFASGIADLTGAALIVALMSVLLRLSLRQYNTSIHLSHDAEERVTMLKTYLALSNEGKLTSDGDMKLVLEALFRPSQSSGIPDSTPATPIELIIKAFTEKK